LCLRLIAIRVQRVGDVPSGFTHLLAHAATGLVQIAFGFQIFVAGDFASLSLSVIDSSSTPERGSGPEFDIPDTEPDGKNRSPSGSVYR
jgi:hypothetical protein